MRGRSSDSSTAARAERRRRGHRSKAPSRRSRRETYHFVLWLEAPSEITGELENAVFEAGCDDALLAVSHSRVFLEFDREAASLVDAVASALHDIRSAGLTVERIGLYDLVNAAEIARRTGRTRASVSQLVRGERGPGGFPPPFQVSGHSPLWLWQDVRAWFARIEDSPVGDAADVELSEIDLAYQLLRRVPDKDKRSRLMSVLETA